MSYVRTCVRAHMQMIMPIYTQLFTYHSLHAPTEHKSISVANSVQIAVFDYILNSNIQITFPFQVSVEVHQPTKFWIQKVQTINNNDTTNYKYCRIYLFLFFTNSIKISSTKMLWTYLKNLNYSITLVLYLQH